MSSPTDYMAMSETTTALLIGAGAGLISSATLAAFHLVKWLIKRHNQVKYLRRCVVEGFGKISSSMKLDDPDGKAPEPKDLRQMFFEEFMRDMEVAMSYRTTELSDNQIFELQKAMHTVKELTKFFLLAAEKRSGERFLPGAGLPTGLSFYRSLYESFRKIEWLKLPEEMPENSTSS